jgi:hypothetical protein
MALVPLVLNIVSCGLEIEFVTIPMQLPPLSQKSDRLLATQDYRNQDQRFFGEMSD